MLVGKSGCGTPDLTFCLKPQRRFFKVLGLPPVGRLLGGQAQFSFSAFHAEPVDARTAVGICSQICTVFRT